MAVFKCKMCGGDLEIQEGMGICECMYCGTKQTLPNLNSERKANLYDRANHFRRNNEYDKAMSMYEQILEEDKEDAEAYWSLVLCTYGIEYVEDPTSHKRIPTVNRTQFTSVFADENYKAALQYADANQRQIYEEEAKQIDQIQKGILDISNQEEPYDVFICYKETDDYGRRTPDSVLANDLYHQLSQEGFKVFFARITLEDKLGSAYEPYIFAALNSAKVMVVIGTKPEYFNAVWVKNEWSRYLSLIRNGAKKVLIPAYKDMDPYDMPQEFSHLQSQDMSKLGFMQDLLRGIKKLTDMGKPAQTEKNAGAGTEAGTTPLLKRAFLFLEDGDFDRADEFCEKVLNLDPENAEAYMGKLMVEKQIRKRENLAQSEEKLDQSDYYHKIMRFGNDTIKAEVSGYNLQIIKRQEEEVRRKEEAEEQERIRRKEELEKHKAETYQSVLETLKTANSSWQVRQALQQLRELSGYKDAQTHIREAEAKLEKIVRAEKQNRKKRIIAITAIVTVVAIVMAISGIIKQRKVRASAVELIQNGEYDKAYNLLGEITDDTAEHDSVWIEEMLAVVLNNLEDEQCDTALEIFGYAQSRMSEDVKEEVKESLYTITERSIKKSEWKKAEQLLELLRNSGFVDNTKSEPRFSENIYNLARGYCGEKEYSKAYDLLTLIAGYKDSEEIMGDIFFPMKFQSVNVGDVVTFGQYEQDGDLENGEEDIEWYVWDIQDNEYLLFSKYILDRITEDYAIGESYSWENSKSREWMNTTFYDKAFSSVERRFILSKTLTNDYVTIEKIDNDGNFDLLFKDSERDTVDKVFALSMTEIQDKAIISTESGHYGFDAATGTSSFRFSIRISDKEQMLRGEGTDYYLLRTIHFDGSQFVRLQRDRSNDYSYAHMSEDFDKYMLSAAHDEGVRPAIWISADAASE